MAAPAAAAKATPKPKAKKKTAAKAAPKPKAKKKTAAKATKRLASPPRSPRPSPEGAAPAPPDKSAVEAWLKAVGYKDEKRPGGYAKWAKTLKVGDFVAIYDPASTKPLPVFALWEVTRKAVSYGPKPYGCRAWRKDNGHTANGYDSGRSVMVPAQYPVLPE